MIIVRKMKEESMGGGQCPQRSFANCAPKAVVNHRACLLTIFI